ncbi:MAG: bifunctional folylpolyglutamate synthase/dihydrofolate synthase, partial [Clostridiales bacterium]|nr:bifunctional folylpolyglutamate synthase/dihydrofolate synthase [Clostridiales bacterium]
LTCDGTVFSYKGNKYQIKLLGRHQVDNAILALETVKALKSQGFAISQEAVNAGLARTSWRGRFEILAREPYFIIDGAHNEDAAGKLREAIETYFAGRRMIFIMGIFADKEYRKVLKIMAPLAQLLITIAPPNSRALPSSSLAGEAKDYYDGRIIDAGTVAAAIEYAYANSRPEDVIVAFGSLSFLQELSELLTRKLPDQKH